MEISSAENQTTAFELVDDLACLPVNIRAKCGFTCRAQNVNMWY